MELTCQGIKDTGAYQRAGVGLPHFDVASTRDKADDDPRWVHLGFGNLFRAFIARMADDLLSRDIWWPIHGVQTIDSVGTVHQVTDHDLLSLRVGLGADGTRQLDVIGSLVAAIETTDPDGDERFLSLLAHPRVAVVTATITEKGYRIGSTGADGQFSFHPEVADAVHSGPQHSSQHAMVQVARGLYRRFTAGGAPVTVISFDNFSRNGDAFAEAVRTIAAAWNEHGFVDSDFIDWLGDEDQVAFPVSVIDKITPRPSGEVADYLAELGFTDMAIDHSYGGPIAGFVNTEIPEYLLIEDRFAGDRPPLDTVGAIFTDRQTCLDFEKMKVTTCLNPVHTALALSSCLLGVPSIDRAMGDEDLKALATVLVYHDSLPVVVNPQVVTPEEFLDELFTHRLTNSAMPDDPARIAMDTSQKLAIRFGETVTSSLQAGRDLGELVAIPLVLALFLRYRLGIDDAGQPMQCSPDPMQERLDELVDGIGLSDTPLPEGKQEEIRGFLSDKSVFGFDLAAVGMDRRVLELFTQLRSAPGAVRATIKKVVK
ncbi:mannitol dehydrogenase family protein [Corynebacterium mendelii]|uniref:Mannitol dehydrogenase family protein n=1 Tax=Corynebacterium mendelii TaxID=2765362 RepID=A0A939DZP9_9CORY|nr:mannitol dehydrogenase family protein [Corynebacterium mendelii]MBN9644008.1 mannitol dehydrogenase family protein [Corynebacterium mendelii]